MAAPSAQEAPWAEEFYVVAVAVVKTKHVPRSKGSGRTSPPPSRCPESPPGGRQRSALPQLSWRYVEAFENRGRPVVRPGDGPRRNAPIRNEVRSTLTEPRASTAGATTVTAPPGYVKGAD